MTPLGKDQGCSPWRGAVELTQAVEIFQAEEGWVAVLGGADWFFFRFFLGTGVVCTHFIHLCENWG